MDKLDIFELDGDTKVITTVSQLHKLYLTGANEQREADSLMRMGKDTDDVDNRPVIVIGDIVS